MTFSVNRIVAFLILSNFFIESSFGFIAPVFSVFIIEDIPGGTLAVAGFAASVYWIAKSVIQIFIARILDRIPGERDDLIALVIGHLIMGGAAFLYLLVQTPLHIYGVQFILAIGGALAIPSWYAMFSRHIDKLKEAFEWSLNSSITFGLGVGVASAIGGLIADAFGFQAIFILAGTVGVVSAIILIPVYRYLQEAHQLYGEHT